MLKSSPFIYLLLCMIFLLTACDKPKPNEKLTTKSTDTNSAINSTTNVIDTATNKTVVLDVATTKIEVIDPKTRQPIQVTPAGLALANILETMAMGVVLKIND